MTDPHKVANSLTEAQRAAVGKIAAHFASAVEAAWERREHKVETRMKAALAEVNFLLEEQSNDH